MTDTKTKVKTDEQVWLYLSDALENVIRAALEIAPDEKKASIKENIHKGIDEVFEGAPSFYIAFQSEGDEEGGDWEDDDDA